MRNITTSYWVVALKEDIKNVSSAERARYRNRKAREIGRELDLLFARVTYIRATDRGEIFISIDAKSPRTNKIVQKIQDRYNCTVTNRNIDNTIALLSDHA